MATDTTTPIRPATDPSDWATDEEADRQEAIDRLFEEASRNTAAFADLFQPRIADKLRGMIPFVPYGYQVELSDQLDRGGKVIVLKSRQIGISTTIMVQKLRRAIFDGATVLVVSRNEEAAKELVKMAQDAWDNLRFPTGVVQTTKNTLEIGFSNGGRIKAIPSSKNAGRVMSASDLVIDEAAFLPWQEEMWRGIRPTVTHGFSIVVVSTPDMEGDLFSRLWEEAQDPESDWRYHEWPWRTCPVYDDEWYAVNRPDYTAADWAQEYECKFGSASDAVFLKVYIGAAIALSKGAVYEAPDPIGFDAFAQGVDVSGEGRDCSVITTIDIREGPFWLVDVRSWEVLPAHLLEAEVEKAAHDFGDVEPWIDRTGLGWGITQHLDIPLRAVAFTSGTNVGGTPTEPNIPRTVLINNLVLGLESGNVRIPIEFQQTIRGLRSYRWSKKRGTDVDFVDSLALAYWGGSEAMRTRSWWEDRSQWDRYAGDTRPEDIDAAGQ